MIYIYRTMALCVDVLMRSCIFVLVWYGYLSGILPTGLPIWIRPSVSLATEHCLEFTHIVTWDRTVSFLSTLANLAPACVQRLQRSLYLWLITDLTREEMACTHVGWMSWLLLTYSIAGKLRRGWVYGIVQAVPPLPPTSLSWLLAKEWAANWTPDREGVKDWTI